MEYNVNQRMSLAMLQVAGRINRESGELAELFFASRLYNCSYPPHLQAIFDKRLLRVEAELYHINREGGYDLREAIAQRMRIIHA